MAIQNTPAHPHTSHAHGSHAAHHGASKAKPSLSADDGDGGFAAMLRAQPAAAKDTQAADKPKAEAKKSDDASSKEDVESKDGKDKDEKKAQARPDVDPNALTAWTPPAAPSTASLADKTAAPDVDPLSALRKAAGKGKGADALAALGAAKDDKAKADPLAALGQGVPGKADITAALAKADEAVKAATEARDSLAALLPQPDPVAIQAGAVGAAPTAVQDPNQGQVQPTPPAQATLAMPPQAPTFAPALGHQIDVWMKDGVQHAEVQLSPQELGPIRVRIEMDGAQTRVHMAADVASTRDALQQAMPQLSDALGQVGISLSGGGVSDQPTFSQAQAQANADGGAGGGRQSGGRQGGGTGGNDDASLDGLAAAPRAAAQRRGLLDMYA